jgi:predicted amidohydrolase YtcJ
MKTRSTTTRLWTLLVAAAAFFSAHAYGVEVPAKDTVLMVNADIVTMNPDKPSVDAMAISGDRIVAIGTEAEVRAAIDGYEKFYNLEGRTVVPGFIETHDHMYLSSSQYVVTDVTPFTTPTLAAALEKIKYTEPDEERWIIGFGADQELYEERRGPTRDLLDEIFPKTPVMVFHLSGHGGFANSEALRLAGINETTPDPQGGYYEKDDSGRLTGYLSGQPALYSVKTFPYPTPAIARIAAEARAAKGVTTASEFAIMNVFVLEGLQKATSSPDFPVRMVAGLFSTIPDFEEIAPRLKNYENDLFKMKKPWALNAHNGSAPWPMPSAQALCPQCTTIRP